MTNKLTNYLTAVLFLIPFTLLVVDSSVLFPFITTKALIFRSLVSVAFFLVAWLYLINPGSFPKKNYLFLAIVVFFIANILSTVFSINPYRSFWGNAERMEGLWSLFFYLSYLFLLMTLVQFAPEKKKIIFISILIVATLISFIQIKQAFLQGINRPSATLGNATYVGFLNLLLIFLILFFLGETRDVVEKFLYSGLIILNLVSLLGSQTRGSILGLLSGIIFGFAFYIIFSQLKLARKITFFAVCIVLVLGFYLFLKTDFALQMPGIGRLAETLKNPVSIFPRIFAWQIFLDAFKAKPIFGWGQESLPVAFFVHFNPQIYIFEKAIFDRPHNKFIEMLVSTGIVGFLTWILIFVAFVYYLLKQKFSLYQKSILFGLLFAYFGQSFSLFDMQASYLVFFFALSLVMPKVEVKEDREKFIRPYLVLVAGVIIVLVTIHIQHYYIVRKIIDSLIGVNPETKLPDPVYASSEFARLSKIAGPFLTEEAIMVANYLSSNANRINNFDVYQNLFEVINKAYSQDRYDYRLANIYIGNLYVQLEILKQMQQDYQLVLARMEKIYQDLLRIYPKIPETYIFYGTFLAREKDLALGIKVFEQGEKEISSLYPKYLLQESAALISLGQKELAYEKLKKFNQINKFNLDFYDYQLMLEIYAANQDVENIKITANKMLNLNKSSSTKAIIREILLKYNQDKILNLDI